MISQALGHKHLDTTIRYLNVLDDKMKAASKEFPAVRLDALKSIQPTYPFAKPC